MTTNGEQVIHSNDTTRFWQIVQNSHTTSPIKQIFHHTTETRNENKIFNNDDVGCMNQWKHVDTTADFISVSNKTGSMSSLSHEKAEIAVLIPQLFQLKKSFALIMNSHTQEKLHSFSLKNYPFGKVKERGGGLEQYLKSEKQLIIKELAFQWPSKQNSCVSTWYKSF